MFPELKKHCSRLLTEFELIDAHRKNLLRQVGEFIAKRTAAGQSAHIVVICTHNSRRSQLGQLWLRAAAAFSNYPEVTAHSCGTTATSFNWRAVKAARDSGFELTPANDAPNRLYIARLGESDQGVSMFSKELDHPTLPSSGFLALTVCAGADAACPVIPGAAARIHIPYDDPANSDTSANPDEAYAKVCDQIGREMLFALHSI